MNNSFKIQSDRFVYELVTSLQEKDQNAAEAIAKKSIDALKSVMREDVELKPFDMCKIPDLNLSTGTKWDLCRLITQVFIGTCAINKGELSDICKKVSAASKILSLNNWMTQPLIEQVLDNPELYETVLQIIQGFPQETDISQIAEICEPIVSGGAKESLLKLIRGIEEIDERVNVLKNLGEISEEIRGEVVEKSIPHMGNLKERHHSFFFFLRSIPQREVIDAMVVAAPIFQTIADGHELGQIIQEIAKLPRDQRKKVLEIAGPFMEGITDDCWVNAIIKAIYAIPEEQREKVAAHAALLMVKGRNSESDRGPLLKAIGNIPEGEREELLAKAAPFIFLIPNLSQRVLLLRDICSIPRWDRDDVMAKAGPLMGEILKKRWASINQILTTVSAIPKDQREAAVASATPLIEERLKSGKSQFGDELAAILCAVGKIPQGGMGGGARFGHPSYE